MKSSRLYWLAVALLVVKLIASPALADDHRFELELHFGILDGPGERLGNARDRGVRDIAEAQSRGVAFSMVLVDGWQLVGSYGRTTARYANIESVGCPLTGGISNPLFGSLCLSLDDRSAGFFVERISTGGVGVSRAWRLGDSFVVFAELGAQHMRWRSADDLEAQLVASCRYVAELTEFPDRSRVVPGCRPVDGAASETAPWAAIRAEVVDSRGWTASAGVHYRGQRHRIYRSDVLDRFRAANCDDQESCRSLDIGAARYYAPIARSSWVWYSVRLGKRVSDQVEVFGEWVGGGTRDWDGGQVGVVLHF